MRCVQDHPFRQWYNTPLVVETCAINKRLHGGAISPTLTVPHVLVANPIPCDAANSDGIRVPGVLRAHTFRQIFFIKS